MITSLLLRHYARMQKRYPSILRMGDPSRRAVALTFDDGPDPLDTPRVLEALTRHEICGTFFLLGEAAEKHSDLVRQVHAGGHQLAIHGYRHTPFPFEQPSVLREELERTRNMLANISGVAADAIKDLRPPYGTFTSRTLSYLTDWGFRLVLWSCIPAHWMQPFSWSIAQLMEAIMPGTVIVLHDGHGHGARVADILNVVVPQIKSRGFEFVRVEEMQNQRGRLTARI